MELRAAVIEAPPQSVDREFWFPGTNSHAPWLFVTVQPDGSPAWRGFFSYLEWPGTAWGLFHWAGESRAVAVAAGTAWTFAPEDPESAQPVDFWPARQPFRVPGRHEVLLVDDTRVCLVAPDGLRWASSRLAMDEVTVCRVTETHAAGVAWDHDGYRAIRVELPQLRSPTPPPNEPDVSGFRLADGPIELRPMTLAGVDAHLAGEDDEQVRWLSGGASTPETVAAGIDRSLRSWRLGGPVFGFGIQGPAGRLIGTVEANCDPSAVEGMRPGEANVSYGLYQEARGKGHATRAVKLVTAFLEVLGIDAVVRVEPENERSIRVALRCGFQTSGEVATRDGKTLLVIRRDPDQSSGPEGRSRFGRDQRRR